MHCGKMSVFTEVAVSTGKTNLVISWGVGDYVRSGYRYILTTHFLGCLRTMRGKT